MVLRNSSRTASQSQNLALLAILRGGRKAYPLTINPGAFRANLDRLKSGHALPDYSFSASGGVVDCSRGRLDSRSGLFSSSDVGCYTDDQVS